MGYYFNAFDKDKALLLGGHVGSCPERDRDGGVDEEVGASGGGLVIVRYGRLYQAEEGADVRDGAQANPGLEGHGGVPVLVWREGPILGYVSSVDVPVVVYDVPRGDGPESRLRDGDRPRE